jgi:hypothetical protein
VAAASSLAASRKTRSRNSSNRKPSNNSLDRPVRRVRSLIRPPATGHRPLKLATAARANAVASGVAVVAEVVAVAEKAAVRRHRPPLRRSRRP